MNMVIVEKVDKKKLKTGFTTGTSATAAAKAALLSIINQTKIENIDVKLPKGNFIKIPIHLCKFEKNKARCSVIKDGGDDPDVTHGAEIIVNLSPNSISVPIMCLKISIFKLFIFIFF